MKFYFFTKGDKNVASSRYRAYYIAECLQERGYDVMVTPVTDRNLGAFFRYLKILLATSQEDVIYLQRTVYNRYFTLAVLIARLLGKRYIFDIDDAVFEHSYWKTRFYVQWAEVVTCGSSKIREWTTQFNSESHVFTNSVPLSIYTYREHEPEGPPVIGWIGALPELFMKPSVPVFHELARRGVEFHLKIIGAMGNPAISKMLEGVPNVTVIDSLNWSDPNEAVREIKSFTIGIMPLTTNSWDQVKYFKALEYMACGVPVIATSGVTVKQILETYECGLTASTIEEWIEHITNLLSDSSQRLEMGKRGRAAIEKYFSIEAKTTEFLDYVALSK